MQPRGRGIDRDSKLLVSRVSDMSRPVSDRPFAERKKKKKVQPIDIRENQEAIDRVNMYASCELLFHVSL